MRGNRRSKHKSTSRLKEMTMLAFRKIFTYRVRSRKLRKSTVCRKDLTKSIRKIFTYRVSTKNTNRSVEMSANHSRKILIDG